MRPHKGGRYAAPTCAAQVIARERLFRRLAAKPIVVLTGTAGYGKTVLVSSWLAQAPSGGAVARLTLDPADCDPGRLAADVLSALQPNAQTHSAHVYPKLGVTNRRAAVRRSAELGLL